MKSKTRLDSAIFQLTPTRTRCDLYIIANEKKEKIASGLLNPFLAHLKTARDQIAKGGYSVLLEPEPNSNATWFTKGTLERFVRFVSTPEILERVYTIESEILQIEEAIAIQGNGDIVVEGHQAQSAGSTEGIKSKYDANEDRAIVLYQPGPQATETNHSNAHEGNSKVQFLKVLETRKTVLQKEQGMAFARAVAAGFHIEDMLALVSFAECFGASRFMDACTRFIDLWRLKHESGQWLEIEAGERLSTKFDFSAMNASGIVLSSMTSKSGSELGSESTDKPGTGTNADQRRSMDHQVTVGPQEYIPGHFLHPVCPPWPMQSSAGAMPIFLPYPMQGMSYKKNCPGNGPFYQPPYPSMEDSPLDHGLTTRSRRQSMDRIDSSTESETWEMDGSKRRLQKNYELKNNNSHSPESRKKTRKQGKKQTGMVVVQNINYVTSSRDSASEDESESSSDSKTLDETEADRYKNSSGSSKRKGNHTKYENDKEEIVNRKETEAEHWQAFQNYLLSGTDEGNGPGSGSMFAMLRDPHMKRQQSTCDDPLAHEGRLHVKMDATGTGVYHEGSGNVSGLLRISYDDVSMSMVQGDHIAGGGPITDLQSTEINGRKIGYRNASDAHLIGRRDHSHCNSSNPLSRIEFEDATASLDRSVSHDIADEAYIVAFRSMSLEEGINDSRNAINMNYEFPLRHHNPEKIPNRIDNQVGYEPHDLRLVQKSWPENRSVGYDPALDYNVQFSAEGAALNEKRNKKTITDGKQGSKNAIREGMSKVSQNTSDKKMSRRAVSNRKPSKMNPVEDARARAEKLRSFKADLQKMKKEQEAAEQKRLEALKMERQKRIAARANSMSAQASMPTRKQLPTKLSPVSHRGSKFSDSWPGPSSPLQRSKIRPTSLGSSDSKKSLSKVNKSGDRSHLTGNRLARSASSLSDTKKEVIVVTPVSKAFVERKRRLSEPKKMASHTAGSVKKLGAESVPKGKLSDGSKSKKISAIINLDRSKAATLPELKIKTSKMPSNSGLNTSASKEIMVNAKEEVEKTDVVLELEKPSLPIMHASEELIEATEGYNANHGARENLEVRPSSLENGMSKNPSSSAAGKTYQAPWAHISSLVEPSTRSSGYGKPCETSFGIVSSGMETVKAHISDYNNQRLEKIPEDLEKSYVKEPKGFKRLLKLGKKSHSSRECASSDGGGPETHAAHSTASGEVGMLKNLISQDETPTAGGTSQKPSRHFSILSPFRSKTSEKKLAM